MPEERTCGTCMACCLWLGITELKKWPGQSCKHLDGRIPDKRCTIYEKRPTACSNYLCAWRAGLGPAAFRPSDCGVLVTLYPSPEDDKRFVATMHAFDKAKAGHPLDPDSNVAKWLGILTSVGCEDIRVVSGGERPGSAIVHFKQGKVFTGVVMPRDKNKYEDMNFAEEDKPIGSYHTVADEDLSPEDLEKLQNLRHQLQKI